MKSAWYTSKDIERAKYEAIKGSVALIYATNILSMLDHGIDPEIVRAVSDEADSCFDVIRNGETSFKELKDTLKNDHNFTLELFDGN